MLDCRVEMRGRDMRAAPVEGRELLLESGDDVMRALIVAGAGRRVVQGEIPIFFYRVNRYPARPAGKSGSWSDIALMAYGNLQRETT